MLIESINRHQGINLKGLLQMTYKKTISVILSVVLLMTCAMFNGVSASEVIGDANGDGVLSIRDAAYIASALSKGQKIVSTADFNGDGKVDIRDASAIAINFAAPYDSDAKEMLRLVNRAREKAGVEPLKLNPSLINVANVRAEEIAESFSHTRPDGSHFSTVLDNFGISYYCSGENIAAGVVTAGETVNWWINSPSHYENIVNPNFTQLGVGYYYDENSTYKYHWVQIFKCD